MTAKRLTDDTPINPADMAARISKLGEPIEGAASAVVAKYFDFLVAHVLFKKDQVDALRDTQKLRNRIGQRESLSAVALHFLHLQRYWLLMPVDDVLAEALAMLAPSDVEQQLRNKIGSNPNQWIMAAVDNSAVAGRDPVPDKYRHLILMRPTEVRPCRLDVTLLPDGVVQFGPFVEVERVNPGNTALKVRAFAAEAEG